MTKVIMKGLTTLILLIIGGVNGVGQSNEDARRILGEWTFTDAKRKHISNHVRISVVGDSIQVVVQDDYGNYDPMFLKCSVFVSPSFRFHILPKTSDRKGMHFEKTSSSVDEDNDTITITRWIKFTELSSRKAKVSTGWTYNVKLDSSRVALFRNYSTDEIERDERI